MNTNIEVVNFDADKKLLNFTEGLFSRLTKYHDQIVSADVYLKVQHEKEENPNEVEVRVFLPGHSVFAFGDGEDFEGAGKAAYARARRQLSEYKERDKSKRNPRPLKTGSSNVDRYFKSFGFY